ncbi:MAG: DUF4911 domain-containing protein [Eubacteriales bacterium]
MELYNSFASSDVIIKGRVTRSEIQILAKLVEGLEHMGVVTTTDKEKGEVIIQTTEYYLADLKKILNNMPINFEIMDIQYNAESK